MKAENRWASVTFDVLTCPALAAKQLCLRLLGQSWRVVSEWQRPGHGAWKQWQRALSFLGPGGQVLCLLTGHSSLGLVGKYWSRAWATWKWLRFCGDRAPTLCHMACELVRLDSNEQHPGWPPGERTASSWVMPLLSTGWPAFDGCLLGWSCSFWGGLLLKAHCSFCIFFNSKI